MSEDPVERYGALFAADGDRFTPTPLTRGPWNPNALHGGAPSALFAMACERHDPGPASFVARLTVELLRPVPLAPLVLSVETIRPGKKVQWIEARLHDENEREVARATALRIRTADVETSGAVTPKVDVPPGPDTPTVVFPFGTGREGFWNANEVRLVSGSWADPGPGTAWFRLRCPVVAGVEPSPLVRVAACADFGSGVGNAVRLTNAAAINAEVSIHLFRHPAGDWVCLDSGGWAHGNGVGLAETRLSDREGPIGRAAQSLLVQPADQLVFADAPDAAETRRLADAAD